MYKTVSELIKQAMKSLFYSKLSLHFLTYNCKEKKHVLWQKVKNIKAQTDQDFSDTLSEIARQQVCAYSQI